MADKPAKNPDSAKGDGKPADEVRTKFLEALAKKQERQSGGVSGRTSGKSTVHGTGEAHKQRTFQRKSGSS